MRIQERNGDRPEDFFHDLPSLDELQRRYFMHLIKITGDNKTQVAGIMGVDRKTVYRLAERYKLAT